MNGAYQLIKSGAGTGVMQGTYNATATRRAYLSASRTGIVIGASTLTLPTPKLLGGDVYADNSVNAGDLAVVGGAYGNAVPADTGADINGDAVVNIFDLVLVGGNYGLTGSVWP